jgi:hypothetical protein
MIPDADALLEQAENLLDQRSLSAALELFGAAETAGASKDRCAAGRWMTWMLLGDFEQAWRESDAIRERGTPDPHRFWNGEDIRGKNVVLRCLHGFGDAVQMLRFAPRLAAQCAALIVEVPPRLLDLAHCFQGVERVITWGALAPTAAPVWDVQIETMELPYLLRSTQMDVGMSRPYLSLPTTVRDRVRSVIGVRRKPRVGLVWAAGDWNPSRTLPLEFLTPLLRKSNCEFWNLQGGKEQGQWSELGGTSKHHDAAQCGVGIVNLAAVIERLDLVITVDTLAAHLAGALGKPAWVLLQNVADWRWMVDRNDSPWYPSLKLYRQHSPGDWNSVLNDVETDLEGWLEREGHLDLAG